MEITLENNKIEKLRREKVGKPLLWIALISIIMFFAGLTSAVVVRMSDGNWMNFEMPQMFLYSSIIIFLSSISMHYSLVLAKKDRAEMVKIPSLITLGLGILFIITQILGYRELISEGIYFTGPGHNDSASYVYLISAVHLLHLLGGMIALAIVVFHAIKASYNSKNLLGLQLCSTYWHFLGGLWIYLYVFFSVVI